MKKQKLTYISEETKDSGGKLKEVKEKLKQCQKEKEEYLTQAQRARADLINYRNRQEKILAELRKFGSLELVVDLLPFLDALEAGAGKDEGIDKLKQQFGNILKKHSLEEIKSVGERFNPELYEAVERVESEKESGIIVEEIQKGYLLGGRVLRPSMVKVSK